MQENESKKLQAFLPQQVCDKLDTLAEKQGITRAELSKRVITEWLETNFDNKLEFWS
jgi:predicted DNA-binding protein